MNIYLQLFLLTILQNASYTLIGRARNSKSLTYHTFAATCSNTMWVLVMRNVITKLDDNLLMTVYIIGTVTGSVLMHYISMNFIEKLQIFKEKS